VLGYTPLEVGLAFLPGSLVMGLLSLGFTDKLNMRFGPRRVLITGLCFLLVAMLLFAAWPFTRLVHALSAPVQYIARPYVVYRTRDQHTTGSRAPRRGWEPSRKD